MSRESSATATVPTVGDSMDVGSSSQEEMIAGKDSTPAVVGEEVSQGVDDDGAPASGSHNDHGQTTLTQEAEHEAMPAASAPKRESRLLITKMQMENFKSYGGLREIGPFHKCFSSIVGPNGSGKSNVIDAMLFVFGKRAKKLRLNKVSELIHRSDTYPNLEYARVSVHFVDILDVEGSEDDYEELPGTELVVTRTAYVNNQSKYQVDGKNATFSEVGALLRKRGVDLDNNRFLILQGEVEQIAMMKPKALTPHEEGLLEYLEDIIGSDRFVEAAEEAAKSVETLNDQRGEKLNRLKLAEKEKDALEGEREAADQFLRLDASIRRKQNVLYQSHMASAAANVENLAAKDETLRTRLKHEQEKLVTTLKDVKETKKSHERVSGEHEVLTKEMLRAKEEFNEFERKDIKHSERMKFFKEQSRKLEQAIKKEDKRSKDSLARAAELEGSLEGLERAVGQSEARKESEDAALEQVNESLKGETAELRKDLEGEQERAGPVREEADTLRNKVDTCKCEIKLVRESTESAKKRLGDAETALSLLLEKAVSDKDELANAKNESQTMAEQIRQAEEDVVRASSDLDAATEAMGRAVAAAEEAKASRESAAGKSGALRALLEASAPGQGLHGAGVCGRLGDLGTVGAEYDVAVSSCSGTLDHIVVETAAGATACVEFLKRNSLGRASFVILEKLGHLESALSRPFQAPRGCPRLYDLVQPSEPRFRTAFYLALRDTLVAPNLDTAVNTAYVNGRCMHRMVTASGQLIDRSGAMTGGGNSTKRGAMRTTGRGGSAPSGGAGGAGGAGIVSAAQADKLADEARQAEQAVRDARLSKKEAEGNVKRLRSREKQLQTLIPKLEMRLRGVGASESQYQEQIETLQEQCRLTPEAEAELEQLNTALAKDDKALAKVSKALEKAEASVQTLQKAILEVGGERLKKAVKRADAASKALDEAVAALSRATVDGQGERKKGEKGAKDADKKRSELEKLKAEAEAAKEEFQGMEEKAFEVLTAFEAAEKDVNAKGEELKEIATMYDKAKAMEANIKGVEVDITHQLQDYSKKIGDNEMRVKHWTAELKKLIKLHKKEAEDWDLEDDDDDNDDDDDDDDQDGSSMEDDHGSVAGDGFAGVEEAKGQEKEDGSGSSDGDKDNEKDDEDPMDEENKDGDATSPKKVTRDALGNKERQGKRRRRKLGMLPELDSDELEDIDSGTLKLEIGELEAQKKANESSVNLPALALYRRREQEYHVRVKDLEAATVARNEARGHHEELRRQRLEEFMAGFGQITLRLKEMYQMITLGGDAELELVDSLDPFSEGIVFSVRPPKKSWKNIANLSGGEKTLSSLALVFALHHFKPTPLYVMDEIDAALDFKNVSIVANYIKERTKNAQFIIISLRNNMFELADRLVGIYKTHNVTKSVTINPKEFAQQQRHQQSKVKAITTAAKPPAVLGDTTNAMRDTEE